MEIESNYIDKSSEKIMELTNHQNFIKKTNMTTSIKGMLQNKTIKKGQTNINIKSISLNNILYNYHVNFLK